MVENYITPTTRIHSTFTDAKKFIDEYGVLSWYEREEAPTVEALAQGKRNLVVGEPGVGKSLLLQTIQEHAERTGIRTRLVSLRASDAGAQIAEFVAGTTSHQKTLLLDALDEVKASDIPATIQSIEQVASANPEISIFLSSRWVFINRYAHRFPEYRVITISPFSNDQVRAYLLAAGRKESDVDTLLHRMMSFGHQMLVVQIPRYLSYLSEFLKERGVDAASKVSRNELFEHFIYSKLGLEGNKLTGHKRTMIKRVLEKLALTMEIYQTNVITEDELMTFFDEIESDLKRVALSQIDLHVFYDYSLLKVSHTDPDKIEFDNTEFQEYLAAKEITRLPEPTRAAFAFAVDPQINETYPTWYNALTFLVDMEPVLLGQLVEFSGLRADRFKVMDEAFLNFLGRVDARRVPQDLRRSLFQDVVEYHERTLQWLPNQLADTLSSLSNATTERYLKQRTAYAESLQGADRFVRLANVAYAVGYLLKNGASLDRDFWRKKLLKYVSNASEFQVLQRHALLALQFLGDPSVVEELPSIQASTDELVVQELLDVFMELAPDHPTSVQAFLEAVRRNELRGRYGLHRIATPSSIKTFLKTFLTDSVFRREFMDDSAIFRDGDQQLVEHIGAVLDAEIQQLAMEVLVAATHFEIAHDAERSTLISGLWKLLRSRDDSFITEMMERTRAADSRGGLYTVARMLSDVIEEEDVAPYVEFMKAAGESDVAYQVLLGVKRSNRHRAAKIYEAGRALLPALYEEWETADASRTSMATRNSEVSLVKLRTLLEPEPGTYSTDVFHYYNRHADEITPLLSTKDRERIHQLLAGTIFKHIDPAKHGLTITASNGNSTSYTTNAGVQIFADAVATARRVDFDLGPHRAQILSLIPFSSGNQLKMIFDVIRDIKPGELQHVIDVYKTRHSDLWRHNPRSFIQAIEQYHVIEAVPVLKAFLLEPAWDTYARREALSVVDSIAPDPEFLHQVFAHYISDSDHAERELAIIANGLLITTHASKEAIQWRLREVVKRAAPFLRVTGQRAHAVSDLEDEITSGRQFAKPLMELKYAGYERDFIGILDGALELWGKGIQFHEYAGYLWGIVYAYIDNLKEQRSYEPLQNLEKTIAAMKGRDGANWLAARMVSLRRAYLAYLGKPVAIAKAIAKYNEARKYNDREIRDSGDLFRHVQDALDVDVRRWIEGEGAYDILHHKVAITGRQQYEKLIQKTLKAQIENVLIRRGYQVEVLREPQLLDEKRTDLLIRYGFAGPVVLEVKLSSNKDVQGRNIEKSASFVSMQRYMRGYGASHGIFMLIDNAGTPHIRNVTQTFQRIAGVSVLTFDCYTTAKRESTKGGGKRIKKVRSRKKSSRKDRRRPTSATGRRR